MAVMAVTAALAVLVVVEVVMVVVDTMVAMLGRVALEIQMEQRALLVKIMLTMAFQNTVAMVAMAVLALSGLAFWRDRRRRQRREIDAVGLLPWRDIAALTCFAGLVMLAMAVMGWIRG